MGADDIIELITHHASEYRRRFGVRRLALFGSIVNGTFDDASDVDVLVEFASPSFDDYMDLKFAIQDATGRSVDLVTVSSLKPALRDRVLAEAHDVA